MTILSLVADAAQENRRGRAAIMISKRRERYHFRTSRPERGDAFHQRGADLDRSPFEWRRRRESVDGVVPGPASAGDWSVGTGPEMVAASARTSASASASADVLACSDCAGDRPSPIHGAPMTRMETPSIATAESAVQT